MRLLRQVCFSCGFDVRLLICSCSCVARELFACLYEGVLILNLKISTFSVSSFNYFVDLKKISFFLSECVAHIRIIFEDTREFQTDRQRESRFVVLKNSLKLTGQKCRYVFLQLKQFHVGGGELTGILVIRTEQGMRDLDGRTFSLHRLTIAFVLQC